MPAAVVSPRDLIPTMHYDARTVMDGSETSGTVCRLVLRSAPSRRREERPEPSCCPGRAGRRVPRRPPSHPARGWSHRRRQWRQTRTRRGRATSLLQLTRLPPSLPASDINRSLHLYALGTAPAQGWRVQIGGDARSHHLADVTLGNRLMIELLVARNPVCSSLTVRRGAQCRRQTFKPDLAHDRGLRPGAWRWPAALLSTVTEPAH